MANFSLICAYLAFLTLHILILSPFSSTSTDHITISKNNKLSLRLIHRHSIPSPYYYPLEDDIRAPVFPMEDRSLFLVNISIGEPPVPQLLAMDTGSDVIWVRCTPCDGCNNIFDPKKSSTFSILPTYSPQCTTLLHHNGQNYSPQCSYNITYEDHSSSSGIVALEKFTLVTSSGGTAHVPDAVLGCALATTGNMPLYWDGVFGLEAPTHYHFIARSGRRFSYCIGNITDTHYNFNQLILGEGAILQGDSTPMRLKGNHYAVTLEGISIGDHHLTLNPHEFYYNVIIDSGSTYTTLVKSAYEPLVAEVKKVVDGVLKAAGDENQLCYVGDLERDMKGFPIVSLHLGEGADLVLDVESVFRRGRYGTTFCMAVLESEVNIIGVMSQQYYNVGFDLDAMRVSFQRIDCELLED